MTRSEPSAPDVRPEQEALFSTGAEHYTRHRPGLPGPAEHRFPVARSWTFRHVLGYLRTTSFASAGLFRDGARHAAFEADARALLTGLTGQDGPLVEQAAFRVLLARRPGITR
ncbi:hypothetical protein [Streptomyces globisporus]|uniref:hypothetical protein n=1 Tax=Streptomyces globisporus TaxID=1908 RepID=UPI003675E6C5